MPSWCRLGPLYFRFKKGFYLAGDRLLNECCLHFSQIIKIKYPE